MKTWYKILIVAAIVVLIGAVPPTQMTLKKIVDITATYVEVNILHGFLGTTLELNRAAVGAKSPLQAQADSIKSALLLKARQAQVDSIYNTVLARSQTLDSLITYHNAKLDTTLAKSLYVPISTIDSMSWYSDSEIDTFKYIFPMIFNGSAIATPLDSTIYYMGAQNTVPSTSDGGRPVVIFRDCTLIGYTVYIIGSAASSTEQFPMYVRKNATTDYPLGTTFAVNASANVPNTYYASNLNTDFVAGDKIEVKIITRNWATNTTSLIFVVKLFFKTARG